MTLDASGEVAFAVRPVEGAPVPQKKLEPTCSTGSSA